ncbi:carbohydrate ABC transporter permease [Paenibacillus eucommiae]|uniref:ABC-type glycerol-3-phosphate transport system permease component n=1 Tax=Paenibacillus eucommiae TaxID=1355755 RepID=A0ABS4ITC4_9BACL|nr:carbohydrate ABC transporter permease [Paenibacillus eucommiae]MBP1990763.1 ABC-type glycerol-3-phosphate transport system permease component [Paenibacillus eucommiae]
MAVGTKGFSLSRLRTRIWPKRISRLGRAEPFEKFLYVLLTLLSVFMLMPLVYIFNHALKPYHELFVYPPNVFVREPTLQNFTDLFLLTGSSVVPVTRYMFNSILVTLLTVVLVTIISAMCAYPLSKHRFPGSKLLFATILLTLMFVPEAVSITRYLVAGQMGIMNSYWGHLLPHLAAPVSVFLIKQFVDQVPNELLEAAKMDGAGEFMIFLRIVIPVVMPAIATVAILTFQGTWNSTETSALYMQDESMKTFAFFLSTMTGGLVNSVAQQGAAAAAAVILFLPNLIIFLFFQRKMIATMAHSGIK